MAKERLKALRQLLHGKEDVSDLAALDGFLDDADNAQASEMLSFRVEEDIMMQLRTIAEQLGVGHTILARELLLAGLMSLTMNDELADNV